MIKVEELNGNGKVKVTFVLPHDPSEPRIFVLGDWNGWSPKKHAFVKRNNGTRSVSVRLPRDESFAFRYRTADGRWFNDESVDEYVKNEFGAENCLVTT